MEILTSDVFYFFLYLFSFVGYALDIYAHYVIMVCNLKLRRFCYCCVFLLFLINGYFVKIMAKKGSSFGRFHYLSVFP